MIFFIKMIKDRAPFKEKIVIEELEERSYFSHKPIFKQQLERSLFSYRSSLWIALLFIERLVKSSLFEES